jgi:hypothetical protein
MSKCIVAIGLITHNLPKGAVVSPSRTDKVRLLPFLKKNGKMSKEVIVPVSFREMLRKGIIVAAPDEGAKA